MTFVLLSQSIAFAEDGSSAEKYYFGDHYKIDKDKGFSLDEEEKIKKNDLHRGWRLGRLYVNGFTQNTGSKKNPVFLKNAGDEVVLGFDLEQDIDKLNGDDSLSIAEDKKGYDDYFDVEETNFGRGTLIVKRTNYQNDKEVLPPYTDYLSAVAKGKADTKINLNEEGDYEVALNYVIKSSPRKILGKDILPSYSDYTIRLFKFSVRNGNSMIFPFDLKTGEELSNKSFTENGFRIDLAKSHYLNVYVKREVLVGEDAEDVRENKPAKDGATYTEEGVYTVTVEDTSTNQKTVKKIYVGTDSRYKAYVTTGLSLEEIDQQLDDGASITDDGTLVYASAQDSSDDSDDNVVSEPQPSDDRNNSGFAWIVAVAVLAALICGFLIRRHIKRQKASAEKQGGDDL